MFRRLYRTFRGLALHRLIPVSTRDIFASGRDGIEIIGFFYSPTGFGEAARLCARQLADAGYKVRCTSVENIFLKPRTMPWDFKDTARSDEIGCRIYHLNPPMMPPVILSRGLKTFRDAYNIGSWAWELEEIPPEWTQAIRYVNAVICPSEFTSRTIRKYTSKPVITVPHPVHIDAVASDMREKLGLGKDVFLVSSIFSFGSALERKNPYAAIRAFDQAFGGRDDVCLILKASADGDADAKRKFIETIRPHKNIRLVDTLWSREETLGLIKASNAYLSLHRSEGFGLPIAEAMCLGTPVIATNWSGNTDFCTAENSFPVGCDMVPVQSRHPEFQAMRNAQWADAHVGEAAQILRDLRENPALGREKAERCLAATNKYFSELTYAQALARLKTQGARS